MLVTFYGAAREVTGSMHMITANSNHILLDCGMFQGKRKISEQKNKSFPVDPKIITNVILSHAHIDHSGRIPLLTSNGFNGRIICTRATQDACEYLLEDSAHIQESDAFYLNYKNLRACLNKISGGKDTKKIKALLKHGRHDLNKEIIKSLILEYRLEYIQPLYSIEDAKYSLSFFEGYPYKTPFAIGEGIDCTFYDAGHILGSAVSIIKIKENGRSYTIGYTGDLGRFDRPIIKNPTLKYAEKDRNIDLLIMESTYGNRLHGTVDNLKDNLKTIINDTYNRGGTVLIPAFAYGRTQEIVYVLHELYNEKKLPHIPVYIDSPLANKITKIYGEHPELYDKETHEYFLQQGENPFLFSKINFISSVEESMTIMREKKPHIVIAASGMCEGGRILHHLRHKAHGTQHTILIVGYMAQHTLGRRILEKGREYTKSGKKGVPPLIKILGKEYPLKADVIKLNGFSAHADKNELLRILAESNLEIKKIAVVHGEEDQSLSFADTLEDKGFSTVIPHAGETIQVK